MKFQGYSNDEIVRWSWLRAVEWGALPAYVSQLVAPILFIYYPWYCVLIAVVVLGIIWLPMRYTFVSVELANATCLAVVWFKWPAAIGSAIFLFWHHQPVAGAVAFLWPLLASFAGMPAKIGIIQNAFLSKIGFHPLEVVIVDDEAWLCEMYALVLREWFPGVSSQCFQDGLQALQYLEQHDPDLLIMDLNRPRMDGIKTLRRLAALQKTYRILVVSGCLPSLEKEARAAAGPLRVSFMSKPLQMEELRRELLNLKGSRN